MTAIMTAIDRTPEARPSWPRDIAIRLVGIALLASGALASRTLCRMANAPPAHEATVPEMLLAAAAFLAFTCGLALMFHGGSLFELVPVPTRNRYIGF